METVLANQFKIKYCTLANAKMVTFVLSIGGGTSEEESLQKGITHLVEHLCFRRVAGMNQADFYYSYEKLGATLRAVTYNTHLMFELTINPKFIIEVAKILRSLYENNQWTHEDVYKEKQVVKKQIEDNYYLFESFMAQCFKSHLVGKPISGTASKINQFSLPQLNKWKDKLFTADNSQLTIVGIVSDKELNEIGQLFADVKGGACDKKFMSKPSYFLNRKGDCATFTEESSTHTNVILSFDINFNKTSLAQVQMLESALAKGDYTPLKLCLREELGLLHEIDSDILTFDFGGVLYFGFRVLASDTVILLQEIATILETQKRCLDEKAFICAKAAFCESNADLETDAKALAYSVYNLQGVHSSQEYISQYESVSYTQMQIIFNQIINDANLFVYIDDVPNGDEYAMLRKQIWDAKNDLTKRIKSK